MQVLKKWMFIVVAMVSLGGGFAVVETLSSRTALAQPGDPWDNHWRFHDGRWSYWNQGDKRWYYTDGHHWYFHDGKVWAPYKFDREFGRKGFERGAYRFPEEKVKIELPNHKIYVGP